MTLQASGNSFTRKGRILNFLSGAFRDFFSGTQNRTDKRLSTFIKIDVPQEMFSHDYIVHFFLAKLVYKLRCIQHIHFTSQWLWSFHMMIWGLKNRRANFMFESLQKRERSLREGEGKTPGFTFETFFWLVKIFEVVLISWSHSYKLTVISRNKESRTYFKIKKRLLTFSSDPQSQV